MQQWEYYAGIFAADVHSAAEHIRKAGYDPAKVPVYSPYNLTFAMNQLGAEGWDLVHMQPVVGGSNGDVAMFMGVGAAGREWTHSCFCVFKRPRPQG